MLIKAKASFDATWWVQKTSSIFAIFFLFLTIIVGIVRYKAILEDADGVFYLIVVLIQPAGDCAGMFFGWIARLIFRDQMTVSFETGIQSFATGMALAQL